MKKLILLLLISAAGSAVYAALPAGIEQNDLAGIFSVELKGIESADASFNAAYESIIKNDIAARMQKFRRFKLTWNPSAALQKKDYAEFINKSIAEKKKTALGAEIDEDTDIYAEASPRYFIFATINGYSEDYNESTKVENYTDSDGKQKTRTITEKKADVDFTVTLDFADVQTGRTETHSSPVHGSDSYTETTNDDLDIFGCLISIVVDMIAGSNREGLLDGARESARSDLNGALSVVVEKNRVLWIDSRIAGFDRNSVYLNKGKIWDIAKGDEFIQRDASGSALLMLRVRKPRNSYSESMLLWGKPEKAAVLEKNDISPFGIGISAGAAGYISSSDIKKNALSLIRSGSMNDGDINAVYPCFSLNLAAEIAYDWRLFNAYSIVPLGNKNSYIYDISFGGGKRIYAGRASFDLLILGAGSILNYSSDYAPQALTAEGISSVNVSGGQVEIRTAITSFLVQPRLSANYQLGTNVFTSVYAECGIPVIKDRISVLARQDGADIFNESIKKRLTYALPGAGFMCMIRF